MRTVVAITALNEGRNIGSVLSRVPEGLDVIVVDDGSTDDTVAVARSHGAWVVRHPVTLGQGAALITSFRAALMEDYDVLIEMDGDGQHDPSDIPRFISELEKGPADIVIGSRILGMNYPNAPFLRRKMLPVFTAVINLFTGYSLTDSMCGFRAFRVESLRRIEPVLLRIQEPQYVAAEMFIRFARAGLTATEIPIDLLDRQTGRSYKGLTRYGWGVSRAVLRTIRPGRAADGDARSRSHTTADRCR
jgi:glycosyltransferase involved in cell wall biosynthesis